MIVPQTSLYMGSSSTPIVFAEIVPIVLVAVETEKDCNDHVTEPPNYHHQQLLSLTNFGVKQFLLRETRESSGSTNRHPYFVRWKENDSDDNVTTLSGGYVFQSEKNEVQDLGGSINCSDDQGKFPLVYIPSDNPSIIDRQPCCIIAYAYRNHVVAASHMGLSNEANSSICHFSQDTLIRILPPRLATKSLPSDRRDFASASPFTTPASSSLHFRRESMLYDLIGEEVSSNVADEMIREVLHNHNEETIQQLNSKISAVMTAIRICTTRNAFRIQRKQEKQMRKIEQSIRVFSSSTFQKETDLMRDGSNSTGLQSWPSLIVHSPNHADGKTLLVHALAKRLGCSSIYLIRPGALLAKYSIRADSALESQLHAILVSAACRNQKVCIILDQLDMMLPARLSGRTSSGDAAIPTFNAIASYLRKITDSMQRKREFPFPIKNPLYNPTSSNSSSGQVFNVKFCLVGIVTCPDDGWRSHQKNVGESAGSRCSILDCMIGDRYRIPLLTAKTILSAFGAAFAREGVTLEASAKVRLTLIVSSAPWAKGSVFSRVAKQLKWILVHDSRYNSDNNVVRSEATVQDLEKALALVNPNVTGSAKVENSIETGASLEGKINKNPTHFGSVGGNELAKISLEDALAFDRGKREMLSRFGLSPPTGVLLYGPPGCGKTLLAKAVARLFRNPVSGTAQAVSQGGTFISLSISKIVSAEFGTSEKTIASSFEFAEKNAPSVSFVLLYQTCTLLLVLMTVSNWI
jgi:SpoVK/Ycf46/Vps4 family AAA+-type ATPase